MNPADAFTVLGLPITASEAEVKAAYRRLVALYHPDTGHENGPGTAEKMRRINEAYAAARATWHRQGSRAAKPIYAPPKPPPRRVPEPEAPPSPEPPPPHEDSARSYFAAAAAADVARRAALVDGLVRVGFLDAAGDLRRSHPVVDAFLPLLHEGAVLSVCQGYDALAVEGRLPEPAHVSQFSHAVPSARQAAGRARAEAFDRIRLTHALAATDDLVLWSTSRIVDDGSLLLREDIHAFAAPRAELRGVRATEDALEVVLADGTTLRFRLPQTTAADVARQLSGGA